MRIRAIQIDFGFVAIAAATCVASLITFAPGRRPRVAGDLDPHAGDRGAAFESSAPTFVPSTRPEWKSPAGAELFASPARSRAMIAAISPTAEDAIEVIDIRPEPFRLRLIGVVGAGDDAHGLFEETSSGAVLLARRGEMLPRLRLQVEEVGLRPARPNRAMSTVPSTPTAQIRDFESGQVLALETESPTVTNQWIATLQIAGETREVRVGDSLVVDEARHRIESVTATTVVIAKESAEGTPTERRVLVVSGAGTPLATEGTDP